MVEKRRARQLVKAVDTNVLARALMRDDPVQTPIADALLSAGVFVPLTVVLETAWLLRSRYGLDRRQLASTLQSLLDMPRVVVDGAAGVGWAIGRLIEGGDIADLIHIVAGSGASAFLTFDVDVAKSVGAESPVPVETLA